jgi:DNA-binding FadR family transcriptional regulator
LTPLNTDSQMSDLVGLLEEFIVEQNLNQGDRLPSIRELAVQFGVKAGVVRDALLEAQGKGLIKVLPRAGAFVVSPRRLDPSSAPERIGVRLRELIDSQDQNLFHLLDARETLEVQLIAQAARKSDLQDLFPLRQILEEMASIPSERRSERYVQLDIEFHLEIARLSGNTIISAMLCIIMEELSPYLQELPWSPRRHVHTDQSHASIYSALVAGDVELAQIETQKHLKDAYSTLLDEIREPPVMTVKK